MNRNFFLPIVLIGALSLASVSCGPQAKADPAQGAPPAPQVIPDQSEKGIFAVDHPEHFPVVEAGNYVAANTLDVTGVVNPDISRAIPVISMASGKVLEIKARLGDQVRKGQLMLRVLSADISQAFSDYRQALADEALAKAQLERSKILLDKGAIAQKDYEVAVDTEEKARVTVETTDAHLMVLGADKAHPTAIVDIFAPITGVVTDQQVTASAGVQSLNSPNPFTISDLSSVWVICDVYENDMGFVRTGEIADIHLAAYPNVVLKGRIGNILPTLDPNIRTAKVRLEVNNPGMLRMGMFVTATFFGMSREKHASVPSSAILHLHDREWVYVPIDNRRYRRTAVTAGDTLPGDQQEILSGLTPGQRVVSNALVLQNTVEQ
jgi:cobalt-zinc-cadmium efflux system membrane fusion protein